MKILFIHNNYASNNSGEEHAMKGLAEILENNGHTIAWFLKSTDIIGNSVKLKIKAFFTAFYSASSVKALRKALEEHNPDLVQIQNVYPFISPAIFNVVRKKGIPIVMRCPNYRLFCPTGLHLDRNGKVCEKCTTGIREFNGILKNCEGSWFKSIGYSLRNLVARSFWKIQKKADVYIVQSEFQRQKFMKNGVPADKISIVPGLTPKITKSGKTTEDEYITFVGRASKEKGILEFLEVAKQNDHLKFVVAGSISEDLTSHKENSPSNLVWSGFLTGKQFDDLYASSLMIVVPSKWYEGFPNVITRAMLHSKPVVTSNIGATKSIIDHMVNGLLTEPGNVKELEQAILKLVEDKELRNELGKNALVKAQKEYNNEIIYNNLMDTYRLAQNNR